MGFTVRRGSNQQDNGAQGNKGQGRGWSGHLLQTDKVGGGGGIIGKVEGWQGRNDNLGQKVSDHRRQGMVKGNRTILTVVRGGPSKGGLGRWRATSVASCLGPADVLPLASQVVLEVGKALRDRKSPRLNSSHGTFSRMPSSA